jgi:hypothetical protein
VNRLLRVASLALPLALGSASTLAGCGYVAPPALAIATDSREAPSYTLSVDDLYKELGTKAAAGGATATNPTTYTAQEIADLLSTKVLAQVLAQVNASRKVTPNSDDQAFVDQRSQAQQSSQGSPYTDDQKAQLLQQVALARVLAADFFAKPGNDLDTYAHNYYDQHRAELVQAPQTCLHVMTFDAGDGQTAPTDDQYAQALPLAQAARKRLPAEDFEKVAGEVSGLKEQVPTGNLNCRADTSLPTDVLAAVASTPVGVVTDPIKWRGGYVIVRIDERKPERTPAFAEVVSQMRSGAQQDLGGSFAKKVYGDAFKAVVVQVDARFGRWDPDTGQILPPQGAGTPTTATTTTTTLAPLSGGPGGTTPGSTPAGSVPAAAG